MFSENEQAVDRDPVSSVIRCRRDSLASGEDFQMQPRRYLWFNQELLVNNFTVGKQQGPQVEIETLN